MTASRKIAPFAIPCSEGCGFFKLRPPGNYVSLFIDSLFGFSFQMPTGRIAEVGKKGVNACLISWGGKVKIGRAIFLWYGVIDPDLYLSELLPPGWNPESKGKIIA